MTTSVLVMARAVHIGGAMMLFALPFFTLVILGPAFRGDRGKSCDSFCKWIIKWLWAVLILEALSGVIWFWFVTAQMSDQSPWGILNSADIRAALSQTQFGRLWLRRAALGIALGVVLSFASRKNAQTLLKSSLLNWLILAISGGLLVTLTWAGHAAAGIHYHVLHMVADALHLLIGSIWPMGLLPLGIYLRHVGEWNPTSPADEETKALSRFSQASLLAIFILVATGVINGWLMIGSWNALLTTIYGRLLLAKVLMVAIMVGLGAVNRYYLLPRMQVAPIHFQTLRRTTLAESILALIVLFIVGTMGTTSPPG